MSVDDSQRSEAALIIMHQMCRVAILAAAGPGNGRGEEAVKWWQDIGARVRGWDNQGRILALAVGYAAGHLTKQGLKVWQEENESPQ